MIFSAMASVKKSTKASATDLAHARKQAQMKLKFCVPHLNYRSMTRAIAFLQLVSKPNRDFLLSSLHKNGQLKFEQVKIYY